MNILLPLSITLLFETSIYMILNYRSLKLFFVASLMNIILNVSMNLLLSLSMSLEEFVTLLVIYEVVTVFAESIILRITMRIKYWKTLVFSFLANATSFGVGLILNTYVYQHKIAAIIVCSAFFLLYLLLFVLVFFLFAKNREVRNQNNKPDKSGRDNKEER